MSILSPREIQLSALAPTILRMPRSQSIRSLKHGQMPLALQIVPQQGTADLLDTLGDKIMTPVVYQNRGGTESLWANQTVMLNFPAGPSAVRWYQFDVTGGSFPATPVQQQDLDQWR